MHDASFWLDPGGPLWLCLIWFEGVSWHGFCLYHVMPPTRWDRVDPHRPMPVHEYSCMQSEGLTRSCRKQRVPLLTIGEHMRHNPYPDNVWVLKTIFPRPCLRTSASPCPDHVWTLQLFFPGPCLKTCRASAMTYPRPIPGPCLSTKTIFPRPCLKNMQAYAQTMSER